jgi:hypothetical protein
MPQLITALGNANINVGGREITIGQQSVNIRGVGLIDDGGNDDLTKGYKVDDIENVVLTQSMAACRCRSRTSPVYVGYVPRLGIAGRDHDDDVARRSWSWDARSTPTTSCRASRPRSRRSTATAACRRASRSSLLRPQLAGRRHHAHGAAQSDFRLPAGVPHPVDFPRRSAQRDHRRRQHSVRAVLRDHHAGAAGRGRQPAVGRRRRLRHHRRFRGDSGREHFPQFPGAGGSEAARASGRGTIRDRSDKRGSHRQLPPGPIAAPDFISALQVDKAVLFSAAITVAAFVPLFTMQGVEGQIFGPDGADLRLRAGRRADRDLHGDAGAGVVPAAGSTSRRSRPIVVRACARSIRRCCDWALAHRKIVVGSASADLPGCQRRLLVDAARQRIPAGAGGRQFLDPRLDAADHVARRGHRGDAQDARNLLRHPEVITVVSQHGRPDNGSDASPFSNVELFVPLKPFDEWPAGPDQGKADRELQKEFDDELPGRRLQLLAIHPGQRRGGALGRQGRQLGQDRRPNLEVLEELATRSWPKCAGQGHRRSRHFPRAGPAESQHQGRSRQGRALRPQYRRRQHVIQAAMGGAVATTVLEGDRQFNLTVRLAPEYRDSIDAVGNIKVGYPDASAASTPISR